MRSHEAVGSITSGPVWLRGAPALVNLVLLAAIAVTVQPARAAEEGVSQTETAVSDVVEQSSRADAELVFVDDPVSLIGPSPFYLKHVGGVRRTLERVAFTPRMAQPAAVSPVAEYSLARRSPLIRGGVVYSTLTSREASTALNAAENSAAEASTRQRAIEGYLAAIAELENSGGAWNGSLPEELQALGTLLQQQGEHEEAVKVFDRAVHIDRINSGLHSMGQVASVEKKVQSHLALNQWDKADDTFDYLYFIQRREYGASDPRLIPVLDSIAEWNLRAFLVGHGDALVLRLTNALHYYNAAASLVQRYFGSHDERFLAYQRGIVNSSYLLVRNPELLSQMNGNEYRNAQSMMRERLEQSSGVASHGYASGVQALTRLLQHELTQRDDALALADALTNLADWYLLFGRREAAQEQYRHAWNLLVAQPGANELVTEQFGRVLPIPTFVGEKPTSPAIENAKKGDDPLSYDYADVMLDVTETGIVRNVRLLSMVTEDNAKQLSRLRRLVRDSTFRPVIKDGIPQRAEGNVLRYRYWY